MEKNSKLLSVIVPVYKAEKYLHRCVDSILAQTWSNLEVILVDDGSPDNSGALCDEYAGKDSRVRVIHKPNGGVSSARNAGIDAATGDYIAFVDSDDYIAPEMYEKLFDVLTSENSIAVCDCFLHYQDKDIPKVIYDVNEDKVKFLSDFLISDIGGSCWNMITPISLISSLRFPEYLCNGEDRWFMLRLFSKAEAIIKYPCCLYYYDQVNLSSLTHRWSYDFAKACSRGYVENLAFIRNDTSLCGLEKEWAWSALRYKSVFVMDPKHFRDFNSILPEANDYIADCPLVSGRVRKLMYLLNKHLFVPAALLVFGNKIRRCVTHI